MIEFDWVYIVVNHIISFWQKWTDCYIRTIDWESSTEMYGTVAEAEDRINYLKISIWSILYDKK